IARLSADTEVRSRLPIERSLIPEIPGLGNELLPNALYGWIPKMQAFLKEYSFDRNVFLMYAYRSRITRLVGSIKKKLQTLELNPIIAKEHALTDDLYNPIACLLCCNYGIAVFDHAEPEQTHNPNIIYE